MNKRHFAGNILSLTPFGVSYTVRTLKRGRYLTVLAYHRVLDRPADFPFDNDLVSASVEQFTYQLSYISRHYNVFNFKTLNEHLERTGRLPERSLIVTFDDGYIDNYEVAFPILKRFGLTATMFITAGFIGENRCFWWDKIAMIVKNTNRSSFRIDDPVSLSLDFSDFGSRQQAAHQIIKTAKTLRDEEKEILIRQLSSQLDFPVDNCTFRETMTWDHVRELSDSGIEIGAHSVNHPIFSNVDEERLRMEVIRSKSIIERETGTEVISFGAPGRGILTPEERDRFEELLERTVKEAGYHFSTQYKWGLMFENDFDPYAIKRLGIETHDTNPIFRAKLAYPDVVIY